MHYVHHKLTDVMKVFVIYSIFMHRTVRNIPRYIRNYSPTWIKFITRLIILLLDGRLNEFHPGTFLLPDDRLNEIRPGISISCFHAKCKNINRVTFFFYFFFIRNIKL